MALFRRIVASLLSVVVFLTGSVFAHSHEANVWAARRKVSQPLTIARLPAALPPVLPAPAPASIPSRFVESLSPRAASRVTPLIAALPAALGSVRGVSVPSTGAPAATVIHVQDVHLNPEAQQNISRLVEGLAAEKKVDLVALEGAFGPLDLAGFQKQAPVSVRAVGDYLLEEKRISGAVHAGFMNVPAGLAFAGIDDRIHYDANVAAYRASAPHVAREKENLARKKFDLTAAQEKFFNPELASFDAIVEAHRSGNMSWGAWVRALAERSSNVSTDVDVFLAALSMESSLDFPRVESERARLLSALVSRLSPRETEQLLALSAAYKAGDVRNAAFYEHLKNLCAAHGVSLKNFSAMDAYIRYTLLSDSLNVGKIMDEATRMERAAHEALARSDEERALIRASRRLHLATRLTDFALTQDEWQEYKAGGLDGNSFEAFYTEAEARDRAMAQNLLREIRERKSGTVVLVTGGFHSEGINAYLKNNGVAVVAFTPRITTIDAAAGTRYLSVFTQEKTPLDRLFAGEKLFVSPPVMVPAPVVNDLTQLHAAALTNPEGVATTQTGAIEKGLQIEPASPRKRITNFWVKWKYTSATALMVTAGAFVYWWYSDGSPLLANLAVLDAFLFPAMILAALLIDTERSVRPSYGTPDYGRNLRHGRLTALLGAVFTVAGALWYIPVLTMPVASVGGYFVFAAVLREFLPLRWKKSILTSPMFVFGATALATLALYPEVIPLAGMLAFFPLYYRVGVKDPATAPRPRLRRWARRALELSMFSFVLASCLGVGVLYVFTRATPYAALWSGKGPDARAVAFKIGEDKFPYWDMDHITKVRPVWSPQEPVLSKATVAEKNAFYEELQFGKVRRVSIEDVEAVLRVRRTLLPRRAFIEDSARAHGVPPQVLGTIMALNTEVVSTAQTYNLQLGLRQTSWFLVPESERGYLMDHDIAPNPALRHLYPWSRFLWERAEKIVVQDRFGDYAAGVIVGAGPTVGEFQVRGRSVKGDAGLDSETTVPGNQLWSRFGTDATKMSPRRINWELIHNPRLATEAGAAALAIGMERLTEDQKKGLIYPAPTMSAIRQSPGWLLMNNKDYAPDVLMQALTGEVPKWDWDSTNKKFVRNLYPSRQPTKYVLLTNATILAEIPAYNPRQWQVIVWETGVFDEKPGIIVGISSPEKLAYIQRLAARGSGDPYVDDAVRRSLETMAQDPAGRAFLEAHPYRPEDNSAMFWALAGAVAAGGVVVGVKKGPKFWKKVRVGSRPPAPPTEPPATAPDASAAPSSAFHHAWTLFFSPGRVETWFAQFFAFFEIPVLMVVGSIFGVGTGVSAAVAFATLHVAAAAVSQDIGLRNAPVARSFLIHLALFALPVVALVGPLAIAVPVAAAAIVIQGVRDHRILNQTRAQIQFTDDVTKTILRDVENREGPKGPSLDLDNPTGVELDTDDAALNHAFLVTVHLAVKKLFGRLFNAMPSALKAAFGTKKKLVAVVHITQADDLTRLRLALVAARQNALGVVVSPDAPDGTLEAANDLIQRYRAENVAVAVPESGHSYQELFGVLSLRVPGDAGTLFKELAKDDTSGKRLVVVGAPTTPYAASEKLLNIMLSLIPLANGQVLMLNMRALLHIAKQA